MKLPTHEGKGRVRSAWHITVGAFRASPGRAFGMLVLVLLSIAGDLAVAWGMKAIVDAAVSGDVDRALRVAVFIGIASLLDYAFSWLECTLRVPLVERTGLMFEEQMLLLTTSIPGITHHETPEFLDKLEQLRNHRYALGLTVTVLVFNLQMGAKLLGTMFLLSQVHPVLLLLPIAGLPSFVAGARATKMMRSLDEATTERSRQVRHLFELGTTAAPGKELRVFGIGDEIARRHRETQASVDADFLRGNLRAAVWGTLGTVCFASGYIATIAFVVVRAARGQATPGEVVLALALASQVNGNVHGFVGMYRWLLDILLTIGHFRWLVDYAKAAEHDSADAQDVPPVLRDGIRFDGVAFRYPNGETDAISAVDLHLPAGSTVAFVGENGAGKTTLVKLLCRFYAPTEGRVTVDGIDLDRIPPDAWRARLSAGFQDFVRFELAAREAVGIGDLPRLDDRDAIETALRRAHAEELSARLPDGLDTMLGHSVDGGRELSGGQWQKLALGRAMMRDDPLLLMLDEPTSALDAETEHALFLRFAGAAERVRSTTGAITLLVSHRFSTVAMADLIVVIDEGHVAEVGSHRELMRQRGLYAELYELQARSYR
ncbi:MAG TPA: ABC transporter ATP-binding protein [Acidimicrobiales bacterium]|nr:ABC transporter ATP-binding protein [Acidimicrobiales bacterium]